MFAYSHPDSSPRQSLTFIASFCLQSALLLAIASLPVPHSCGARLGHHAARAAVTPIYFQPEPPASPVAPSKPEPAQAAARPAPQVASKALVVSEQASNPQPATAHDAAADDNSGDAGGQGLAPFASWSMNAMPSGFAGFHHQMNPALPVFTPDPPILHGQIPEPARGKDIVLEVVIDDQGSIVQAKVLQGIGYGIENSVMETLGRWIYVPAKVNGMAIATRQQLRFHFPG